jgi:hypothetical protein
MTKSSSIASCVAVIAGVGASAQTAPQVEINNNLVRVRLYLPENKTGFYRGTRFDWSGVIGGLTYAGIEFYPQWFQRTDLAVHDFIYDGPDIVAGPCTAITGPAEEFVSNGKALGFDEAKPGGTFIKIGVGVLRRPDDRPYDPYRLYEIVDGGRWTVTPGQRSVVFNQILAEAVTGYGYEYQKTVSLADDQPQLVLAHTLRNTANTPSEPVSTITISSTLIGKLQARISA